MLEIAPRSDEERIDQSHWSTDRIVQMRLINSCSVRNLGKIFSIVDTALCPRC